MTGLNQPPYAGGWPDPSPPGGQPPPGPPGQPQWNPQPGPAFYPGTGPPGYGQPGYGPPGPMPGYGYPPPPRTNSMAVAAMVVSIGSAVAVLCTFCITVLAVLSLGGGITGAILGFVARRQIRERGERGDGMALTGIIVGLVAAALSIVAIAVVVLFLGFGLWFG